MSKRKLSDRKFLIEQCLQDAQNEYMTEQLNEGWWDDFMAKERGGWEATKTRAGNLFRRGKNKKHIETARLDGSVKSYAKSLANTMQSFKRYGGSLGNNIKNVDDVINRLKKVASGQPIPQSSNNRPQQTETQQRVQPQQTSQEQTQNSTAVNVQTPQQTAQNQETSPGQTNRNTQSSQNATIARKKSTPVNLDNATITNKGKGVTPLPIRKSAPANTNQPVNTPGQDAMLNSIEEPFEDNTSQAVEEPTQTQQPNRRSAKERLKGMRAARKAREKEEKVKAKRDTNRKKRQDAINQRKNKEQAQQAISPQWEVKPNPINKTKPGKKPVLRKTSASSPKNTTVNSPASQPSETTQLLKGKGTNVGDISNITQQQPLTTSIGDTIVGGYDANSYVEPKGKISNQQAQLPAPQNSSLGLPAPQKIQQLQLMNNSDTEDSQNVPLGLPSPSKETSASSIKKGSKRLLTQPAPTSRKLNVGKRPVTRKRILTAKDKLNNERQKEKMDKWVNNDPDMFMHDSYNPWSNSNAQIQMINSIK